MCPRRSLLLAACVLLLASRLQLVAPVAAGGLPEPDVDVATYVSPSELEVLHLFEPTAESRVPPPPPTQSASGRPPAPSTRTMPPMPPRVPTGRRAPPVVPSARGVPSGAPSHAARHPPALSASRPAGGRTVPDGVPEWKRKKAPRQRTSPTRSPPPPAASSPRRPSAPSLQQFDGGEVDPRAARKQRPAGPPPAHSAPMPPPPRDTERMYTVRSRSPPPPQRELTYAEVRAREEELYQQQKRRYAQLVAFHTATHGEGGSPPPPPPTLAEMREKLRADGLSHPPAFDAAAAAGDDLPPEVDVFGGEEAAPPMRAREFVLPAVAKNPAWRQKKPRRRAVHAGQIERIQETAHLQAQRAKADKQKEDTLKRVRASLVDRLTSDTTAAHLRSEIDALLQQELSKLSKEEVAAHLEALIQRRQTTEATAAAAAAGTGGAPAATSHPPAPKP